MSQIVRRAFRPTPARIEMRAFGLTPRIPVGSAAFVLFGAQVIVTVASLAAL